ncbi:protein of unknown function DUF992 [Methylocella silvestris BL2]|uniref:DUF992 domain-containing protein n=1 Tax=Methylocella silvestris (strain DSM 15510 / CIP 108128 / LMG 27833 / NCIMB 13906 / BL2) TaxID=395965 RepID=B8ET89_METSB|nr:DUF992 domain-containing protein [Methylocella silvestris]ACK51731.1 protein of unknown function DUF992 [Methylocella silvestris BL2]
MNNFFRGSLAALAGGLAMVGIAAGGADAAITRAGVLQCNVAAGVGFIVTSSRALSCVFSPRRGQPEYYVGTIRRFGLDIGFTTGGQFAWAVLAAGRSVPPFALAGEFVGAGGNASFGGGLTANVLVGGNNRSISLQPLSVGVESGINLSAGVGAITLEPVANPR